MMSYDKSNFTNAPNAFVLVTIPKGTKLEHIREVDKEYEDPLWFGFDMEFSSVVFGYGIKTHQTYELTQDIDNIMMYDGRATFLNDLMSYMVYNCTYRPCGKDDIYLPNEMCAMFPEMNGFIRQYYGFELVLCNRVHEKGQVVLVSESIISYPEEVRGPELREPLFDLMLEAQEERRFSYHLDTLILANETYENPPRCFWNFTNPQCSFFAVEQFPDVEQYRSLFREMLRSEPIKGIEKYQQSLQAAIRNLVNRVSLAVRRLKAAPGKFKSILQNTAGVYGLQNASISAQVRKCVSFHTPSVPVGFDFDFIVQNRFDRENELPGKARREVIKKVKDSFQHVTEYICTRMIDMYWNGSNMNITKEIRTMQDGLKWKEFDLCPKECGNKCIKRSLITTFYYCEQGAVFCPGLQEQNKVGRFYRNLFQ
ncbi:hypothetical protein MP638_006075 [Amoeboaphelidium occidentale]|nr:hypothetical protein MP638_006075 [Amoeboaphelidium occidentale]